MQTFKSHLEQEIKVMESVKKLHNWKGSGFIDKQMGLMRQLLKMYEESKPPQKALLTVGDLLEKLKDMDPSKEVWVNKYNQDGTASSNFLTSIKEREDWVEVVQDDFNGK